jgi:hypothetical protein
MSEPKLVEISKSFFVQPQHEAALAQMGLISIDKIFSFSGGRDLAKDNLARHRSRLQFEIDSSAVPTTVFLKRYDRPPIIAQLRNWFWSGRKVSCSYIDFHSASRLSAMGINAPKTVARGEQWGMLFEKRSFIVTEKIPNARSLEQKLPDFFTGTAAGEDIKKRRDFICQLAGFIRKFHQTGYRHRDLYLCHVFYDDSGKFHLIDLARAFRPVLLAERFRRKDIAQLYYSAPPWHFSMTDRLRFWLAYTGRDRLTGADKRFIKQVIHRARRMAKHDARHGRAVGFAGRPIKESLQQ